MYNQKYQRKKQSYRKSSNHNKKRIGLTDSTPAQRSQVQLHTYASVQTSLPSRAHVAQPKHRPSDRPALKIDKIHINIASNNSELH